MLSKDLGIRQRSMLGVASLLLAASMFGPASTVAGAQAGVQCGMGSGQKATGTPIKLGAIVTKQPGTDFTGITGMAAPDTSKVTAAVARIKRHTKLPVAVGFGVRTATHARAIASGADGVVVGSALVDALKQSLDKQNRATR